MPSDKTQNLALPYIYTNQAQKELNVNEAFTILEQYGTQVPFQRRLQRRLQHLQWEMYI